MAAANDLSASRIREEVQRFWTALCSKNATNLAKFYSADASVFGTTSSRSEIGLVATARRQREYFDNRSSLHSQLGPIEVLLAGTCGTAYYTFEFYVRDLAATTMKESIVCGRATQVFGLDEQGAILIMHEHFSTPNNQTITTATR